jgi:hypothetical protein
VANNLWVTTYPAQVGWTTLDNADAWVSTVSTQVAWNTGTNADAWVSTVSTQVAWNTGTNADAWVSNIVVQVTYEAELSGLTGLNLQGDVIQISMSLQGARVMAGGGYRGPPPKN